MLTTLSPPNALLESAQRGGRDHHTMRAAAGSVPHCGDRIAGPRIDGEIGAKAFGVSPYQVLGTRY